MFRLVMLLIMRGIIQKYTEERAEFVPDDITESLPMCNIVGLVNHLKSQAVREVVQKYPLHWGYFSNLDLIFSSVSIYCGNFELHFDKQIDDEQLYQCYAQMEALINSGQNVNKLAPYFANPLDYAVEEAYRLLKEKGALSSRELIPQLKKLNWPYFLPEDYTESLGHKFRRELFQLMEQPFSRDWIEAKENYAAKNSQIYKSISPEVILCSHSGHTLLMEACKNKELDKIKILSDTVHIGFCDYTGDNPLIYALKPQVWLDYKFFQEKEKPHIQHIPAHSRRNHHNFFPQGNYVHSVRWGLVDEQIVATLLASGADPNWVTETGETALILAVEMGKWDILATLLAHGGNINLADQRGQTCLHLVCGVLVERPYGLRQRLGEWVFHFGSQRVLDYLASEDLQDAELEEAEKDLFRHSFYTLADLQRLLALGADPLLPDHAGQTPFDLAKQKRPDWYAYLQEKLNRYA